MSRRRRLLGMLVLAAAGLAAGTATSAGAQDSAESLASAQRLLAARAPLLALSLVERSQQAGSARWIDWETARLRALTELAQWDAIAARAEALDSPWIADEPAGSPLAAWVRGLWLTGAEAALRVPAPARARALALRVLWTAGASADQVRRARLAVIDSHFVGGDPAAGYGAMLRMQQDAGTADPVLAARFVALLAEHGRERDALPWITALDAGHPVRLAAQVRLGLTAGASAAAQARAAIARGGDARFWSVLRSAGTAAGDVLLVLEASEQMLQHAPAAAGTAASALWTDYDAAAGVVANREQLLVGDEFGWSSAAARLVARDPTAARALFARLALRGSTAQVRANAQLQLASSLRESRLPLTAIRLFADPGRVELAAAPELRRLLGELAAEQGQFSLALAWWRELPPRIGEDADQWRLAQAEAFARTARFDPAVRLALEPFAAGRAPPVPIVERTLALAELMGDAAEPARGLALLAPVRRLAEPGAAAPLAPTLRRSVLLAHARLQEAGGAAALAAQDYLAVAAMPEFKPADPVQIEARLRAAQALVRAGLREEARVQFDWIARNTRDAALLERVRREQREAARVP